MNDDVELMFECFNPFVKKPYVIMQITMTRAKAAQENRELEASKTDLRWRVKKVQPPTIQEKLNKIK